MKKLITLLLTVTMVSACGWHLRGSLNLPSDLKAIHISNQSQTDITLSELVRVLGSNGIERAENLEQAQYSIRLSNEREERRSISVSSSGLVSEYELTHEVDYSIADADGNILAPLTTARVIRSYNYDRNDVIAKNEEESLIRKEMRTQLAAQILNRLRFLNKPATASSNGQTAP